MTCQYCGDDPVISRNCYCRPVSLPISAPVDIAADHSPSLIEQIKEARRAGDSVKLAWLKIKLNSEY